MKKLLVAMFVALLVVGCGGDGKSGSDSPESNQSSAPPPESKESSAEATPNKSSEMPKIVVSFDQLEEQGHLMHFEGKPYTGVVVLKYANGQKKLEGNLKDGKWHGPGSEWYENGKKREEGSYNEGKRDGLHTKWFGGGGKRVTTWKDDKREGVGTMWYGNGKKASETTWVNSKTMTVVAWKPNGEKCPVTNVKDGNGVAVIYSDDGTEGSRRTYKDGELVED